MIPIPQIAQKVGPHVPFGEEFLLAPFTLLARSEELLVNLGVVKA
jgi:hypothetical protein